MEFLTETNISLHKEYLRTLKLKLSIFEKTYPTCRNISIGAIEKCRIPREEREELIKLRAEIMAHEVYFSSFGVSFSRSEFVRREYGSEAAFLYAIFEKCLSQNGFLVLFFDNRGRFDYYIGEDYYKILLKNEPILCIDLFEHSYFLDYGFDKKKYLQNALSSLNLSKLNVKKH